MVAAIWLAVRLLLLFRGRGDFRRRGIHLDARTLHLADKHREIIREAV